MGRRLLTKGHRIASCADGTDREEVPSDGDQALSRRRVLTAAVGLAAVGVAGGSVLSEAAPIAASAQTTTQQGAIAPAVVPLIEGPTVSVDASLGNDFRLTLGGDRIMGNPSNPEPGQQIIFQITQGAGAPFTLSWGTNYEFSSSLPQPTLSMRVGQTDLLGFIYNAANGNWLLAAFVSGFG